jgi:hypothetical protein
MEDRAFIALACSRLNEAIGMLSGRDPLKARLINGMVSYPEEVQQWKERREEGAWGWGAGLYTPGEDI